jgi:hypothetical protein
LGNCLPSDAALARLCRVLPLCKGDMKQRVARDRMVFRFGDAIWDYWGVTPRVGQLHIWFSVLDEKQREFARLWITCFCEAKKRASEDA